MTLDAIIAASAVPAPINMTAVTDNAVAGMTSAASTPSSGIGSFGEIVNQGLNTVNQELLVSQTDLQKLAAGNAQNLHQIMIRMEESRLSFELLLQVRNRLLEAYQDVMKMQV